MKNNQRFSYQELIDRNWGYFGKPLQRKIKKSRILLAGCGLGSVIGEAAVRLGFSNFILADGDKVEVSNLNRQSYNMSHLGINKALALSSVMKNINPEVKTDIIERFIAIEDIPSLIKGSDFIVNTVDIGKVYFELIRMGQQKNRHILMPFNIGFGSLICIFNQNTRSVNEIMGEKHFKDEISFYKTLLKVLNFRNVPDFHPEGLLNIFLMAKKKGNIPQTRIGAEIASALVATILIKILSNKDVPLAPDCLVLDLYN